LKRSAPLQRGLSGRTSRARSAGLLVVNATGFSRREPAADRCRYQCLGFGGYIEASAKSANGLVAECSAPGESAVRGGAYEPSAIAATRVTISRRKGQKSSGADLPDKRSDRTCGTAAAMQVKEIWAAMGALTPVSRTNSRRPGYHLGGTHR